MDILNLGVYFNLNLLSGYFIFKIIINMMIIILSVFFIWFIKPFSILYSLIILKE